MGATFNSMQISGHNLIWPKGVDEHVYSPDKIVKRIGEPKTINSIGLFADPELK